MIRNRSTLFFLAVTGCLSAAESSSTSVPTFWRYAHPEAKMYIGIDIGRISSSAVGQRIKQEMTRMGVKKMASDNGMGFFQDIDRVLVSTTGEVTDAKKKQPPSVVAIQGKFDLNAFRRDMARKKAARFTYKNAEIYRRGNTNDMVVAIVSTNVMLLGDGPSLKLAIDNHSGTDEDFIHASLVRRAVELDQLYDVWFASEVSPASAAKAAGAAGPSKLFEETESFEGGISFRKGLGLDFALHNKTAEAAGKLATAMRLLMDLADAKEAETKALIEKVVVSADGQDVHLSLAWEEKEIMAGIDSVLKGGFAAVKGKSPSVAGKAAPAPEAMTAAATPPAPAEPQRPMVVRIINADGGPREVVLR